MRCFFFFVFLLIEVATDGIALAVAVLLSRPAFSVLLLSSLAAVEAAALSVPLPVRTSPLFRRKIDERYPDIGMI